MKKWGLLRLKGHSLRKTLPFILAVLALVLTGCPNNEYEVQLKPQGTSIERKLVFYRANGVNTNTSAPNFVQFDTNEYRAILALYPAQSLTNEGERYVVEGLFTNAMPNDVGGAGAYTNLTTSLGEAGFYEERFRGNDDVAGVSERHFTAADRLTDLVLGWSRMQLGHEPGYDKLREFLDLNFRCDLKNVSAYWWQAQMAGASQTNSTSDFLVRAGQYLGERGYLTIGDIPALLNESGNDAQLRRRLQRLVAEKMGVPDMAPVPASLAFLADASAAEISWETYVANSDLYRSTLKQWEEDRKSNPNLQKPEPDKMVSDVINNLIDIDLGTPDHLIARLSLVSAPVRTNGRWDEALKQLVWDSEITGRTNATSLPFSCYAVWAKADEKFQQEHIGKTGLTGENLASYCLWRSTQDANRCSEWDVFLASLRPGPGLMDKVDAFRFSDEPNPQGTNSNIPSPSAYPRELIKTALK